MQRTQPAITGARNAEREYAWILKFDPTALGKSRRTCAKPVEIQKPNVELFDDPQHNGQYYGD